MPCNHPDSRQVPCMDCGRTFCSICNPPKGSGQTCPTCYEKHLSVLKQQTQKRSVKERVRHETDSTKEKVGNVRGKARDATLAIKDSPRRSASFFREKARNTRDYFKGRFPVTLTKKQELDEIPPLRESWYKFLILTLGGATVWIVASALAHQRNPLTSLSVAVLVAVGVVWTFDERNDIKVAVIALLMALAALLMGEVGLLIIMRLGIVKKMDLTPISVYALNHGNTVYTDFFFKVLVWRIFPSAVIAFLIGLWPLPQRLSWKGFAKKAEPVSNSKPAVENQG
jgi:hypothetical protein